MKVKIARLLARNTCITNQQSVASYFYAYLATDYSNLALEASERASG